MKKKLLLVILLIGFQQSLQADQQSLQADQQSLQADQQSFQADQQSLQAEPKCSDRIILEARASYFRPFSKTIRNIFHNGGVDYTLEATFPVYRGLNIWGAVDYFSRSGTMLGINRSAHLQIVPITLGLKYIYSFNRYYGLYAGAGGKYYFVEAVNRVYPMYRTTHRNGIGGVVEIGNLICVTKDFVIDIFGSASFKKVDGPDHLPPNAHSSRINVGGWNVGGGLGYKF